MEHVGTEKAMEETDNQTQTFVPHLWIRGIVFGAGKGVFSVNVSDRPTDA